jgi:hypothetical protein
MINASQVDEKGLGASSSLVEPGVILPGQFFSGLRRRAVTMSGEYRLALAVLEAAVGDFQKYVFSRESFGRRIFGEVYAWLMDDREPEKNADGLTCAFICDALGLDVAYVREGLERWRHEAATARGILE